MEVLEVLPSCTPKAKNAFAAAEKGDRQTNKSKWWCKCTYAESENYMSLEWNERRKLSFFLPFYLFFFLSSAPLVILAVQILAKPPSTKVISLNAVSLSFSTIYSVYPFSPSQKIPFSSSFLLSLSSTLSSMLLGRLAHQMNRLRTYYGEIKRWDI
jgi:hypothetical protein